MQPNNRPNASGSPQSDLWLALGAIILVLLIKLQTQFQPQIEQTETYIDSAKFAILPYFLIIGIPATIFLIMLILAVKAYRYKTALDIPFKEWLKKEKNENQPSKNK